MVQGFGWGKLSGSVEIRALRLSDIPVVVQIDQSSNPSAWNAANFERELALSFSSVWVASDGSQLIGFAVMWIVQDEAQVLQWAVAPRHRRRGVGAALMRKLLDEAERAGCIRVELEYREGNAAAEGLYRKFGFQRVGARDKFYEAAGSCEAANAILMRKAL